MLRMVLKNGEQIKFGENIIIKSMNEGRCELAIDAPREVKIERIKQDKGDEEKTSSTSTSTDGKKKYVVLNNKK